MTFGPASFQLSCARYCPRLRPLRSGERKVKCMDPGFFRLTESWTNPTTGSRKKPGDLAPNFSLLDGAAHFPPLLCCAHQGSHFNPQQVPK